VDADFLAIYGIDLEDAPRLDAKRFLCLAARLPAYDGAMTAVVASLNQPEQAAAPATPADPSDEVTPDALNLIVPGLIERVEV
jgi:hypothetical protein